MLEARLPIPAYDHLLKLSHVFNVLDARGAVGVTERQACFATLRALARRVTGARQPLPLGASPILPAAPLRGGIVRLQGPMAQGRTENCGLRAEGCGLVTSCQHMFKCILICL